MMWFNKKDPRALYTDVRSPGTMTCVDGRTIEVKPDLIADFRALPFPDRSFWHVAFDPPHLKRLGMNSWTAQKYGRLLPSWRDDIELGFAECFRVLKPNGTLVFKWNEDQIPVAEVLALTPVKPLYGHRSGRLSKTHWITFLKEET